MLTPPYCKHRLRNLLCRSRRAGQIAARLAIVIPLLTQIMGPPDLKAAPGCPDLTVKPFRLNAVAENIYVRQGRHEIFKPENFGAIANVGIIIGKTAIAVIDTGGSYCDGHRFLRAIRQISQKPIRYIILTHAHPDHSFGAAAFKNEQAEFIGHASLARALKQKGPLYIANLNRIIGKDRMSGTEIVLPTKMVQEELNLDLGDLTLKLMAHPTAHTDHDLTVYDPKSRILWAGDLLFHGHIPVVDGSLLGWRRVMKILENQPADYVIPGHGGPLLAWPEGLEPQQQYLETLTRDLRDIIQKGGTMLQAQKKAGYSEKNAWLLFEEFNARNASTGFAELEWE